MSEQWRFGEHGAMVLRSSQGRAIVLSRKDAGLLAYALMEGPVPSARVAQMLWPDAGGSGALNNLRQRLHRLRRASGARLLEMGPTLAPAPDLMPLAMPTRQALEADPGAWDGDLLAGHDYDDAPEFGAWLAARRQAWRQQRREALAAIASSAENETQLARALVYARRLIEEDPLSEHAHRRLMRLHYLRGDKAAAVAAFEACERLLKDELGLSPSAETRQLLAEIERAARPAAITVVTAPLPVGLRRPPRLVGRQPELTRLAHWQRDGGVMVVVGEAGIGKSRLLHEHAAALPGAVTSQARPGDASVPYATLARLLRALGERFAANDPALAMIAGTPAADGSAVAPGAGSDVACLRQVVGARLSAAMALGLVTLVLDDLHFADRASLDLLIAVMEADELAGLRWLLAHRPPAVAQDDASLLAALADAPRATWLNLAPLDAGALEELLDSLALPGASTSSLVRSLLQHTGGNPLYVLETLRAAHEGSGGWADLPRPAQITQLIDRRLQRLGEPAMALARVAALAGPAFSVALAETVLATPALHLAGPWAELEAADVLRGCAFAHDLVRDGVLRATPTAVAVHAHRVIATVLQTQDVAPALLAQHWRAGGEPLRAAQAFRAAARLAGANGLPQEEARLLEHAAAAFDDAGEHGQALAARADAVPARLRFEGVAAAIAAADGLLPLAPALGLLGEVQAARAMALAWAGRPADAEAAGVIALQQLPPDDLGRRHDVTRVVAIMRGQLGRPDEGIALLQPWLAQPESLTRTSDRLWYLGAGTNLLLQADRPLEALALSARHEAAARAADDRPEQQTAWLNRASAQVRIGALREAAACARSALQAGGGLAPTLDIVGGGVLGYALCGLGWFDDALAALDDASERAAASPGTPFAWMIEDMSAQLFERLGQFARARQRVADLAVAMAPDRRANRRLLQALLAPTTAAREAGIREALAAATGEGPARHVRMNALLALAEVVPDDEAHARCDEVFAFADRHGYRPLAVHAKVVRLSVWRRRGRLEALAPAVDAAQAALRGVELPQAYWPALMRECALAHAAIGDTARAADAEALARDWARAALARVPPVFRDSFRRRNAVNLALGL